MSGARALPKLDCWRMLVRRADILSLALVVGLTTAYQLIFLREGIGLIDEGHLANAARRLTEGDLLYRDVYTVYPPASFYVVSVLFDWLGTSLIVVRGFHIAMTIALAIAVFGVGRLFLTVVWATLAALLVGLTGWEAILERCHYAYLYCVFPIAALGILSILLRRDGPSERDEIRQECWGIFGVGMLAGVTLAFRLVPFVGLSLAATLLVVLHSTQAKDALRRLACLILGGLAVVLPIGLAFAVGGGLTDLLQAVFWTSFGQYASGGEFNLPFPPLTLLPGEWTQLGLGRLMRNWEFYLPIAIYIGAALDFGLRARQCAQRRESIKNEPNALLRLAMMAFGVILFLRATGRSDYYHLAPVLVPAYLLGVDFMARAWARFPIGGASKLAAIPVLASLVLSLWLHGVPNAAVRARNSDQRVELSIGGPRVARSGVLDDLVFDLRQRTKAGEPILVLPWYPVLYFLVDRPNPTRYDWLFPGYLTRDEDRARLVEEISQGSVRTLVYNPAAIDGDATRRLAHFEPDLDRAIRQHFRADKQFGRFIVMTRKLRP